MTNTDPYAGIASAVDPYAGVASPVMANAAAAKAPTFSDYAIDAARTIPGGLAKFAAGTLGLPGDVDYYATKGADFLMGVTPKQREAMDSRRVIPSMPTSSDFNKAFSAPTGGYYQPKTTPGEYAQTVSTFLPGMFTGSAEKSLFQKGINTVGSALGSEALGQATKGTWAETPMRIAGALIGHGAASKAQKIAETGALTDLGAAEKTTPSSQELLNSAHNLYEDVKSAPSNIGNKLVQSFKADIQPIIDRIKLNPEQHAEVAQIVDRIKSLGPDATVADLHAIRTNANFIRNSPAGTSLPAPTSVDPNNIRSLGIISKPDKSAIGGITEALDKFVKKLTNPEITDSATADAATKMTQANELYAKGSQGAALDKLISDAGKRGFTNLDQNLRQKFQTLYENSNKLSGFPQEVQDAVKTVATGNGVSVRNAIQVLSKLIPSSVKSAGIAGVAELGGYLTGHPLAPVVAATTIGVPAKIAANIQTANAARLASLLARGGVVAAKTPLLNGGKVLATALASQGTQNQQQPNYEDFK